MPRPLGSRNKTTIIGRDWATTAVGQAKDLLQAELHAGNITVAQFVMKQFCPKPRGGLVTLELPNIRTAADLLEAQNIILQAVTRGEIATGDGQALMTMTLQVAKTLRLVAAEERESPREREPLARSDSFQPAEMSGPEARGPEEEEATLPTSLPPINLAPFRALKVPPDGTIDALPDDDQCSLRRSRGAAAAAVAG